MFGSSKLNFLGISSLGVGALRIGLSGVAGCFGGVSVCMPDVEAGAVSFDVHVALAEPGQLKDASSVRKQQMCRSETDPSRILNLT